MSNQQADLQQDQNALTNYTRIRPLVQGALTATLITTAVYIPEVALIHKTTHIGFAGSMSFRGFLLANSKNLFQGFMYSLKQSYAKNGLLSNKDYVQGKMQESFSTLHEGVSVYEGQSELNLQERRYSRLPLKEQFKAAFATAGLLSSVELVCTQYFAAMKVRSNLGESPVFSTFKDKLKFAKSGAGARAFGISSNASAYVLSYPLADQFYKFLPREQYGPTATVLATGIAGVTGGALSHAASVLFNNIIKETKVVVEPSIKITSPSCFTVAKKLVQESGLKAFVRGGSYAMGITTMAYSIYHLSECIMDYWFPLDSESRVNTEPLCTLIQPLTEGSHEEATLITPDNSDKKDPIFAGRKKFGLFPEANQDVRKNIEDVAKKTNKP